MCFVKSQTVGNLATVVSALAHTPREARKTCAIANRALKYTFYICSKNWFSHCITACGNADCALIWRALMRTLLYHNYPKINRFSVFVCCRMPVVIKRACAVLSAVCVWASVWPRVLLLLCCVGSSDHAGSLRCIDYDSVGCKEPRSECVD